MVAQPSKQAAVALEVAWKSVPRDRYAISSQTLSQVDRGRLKCLRVVGGSGLVGRGPKQSGSADLEGRGGCPGCFPSGWLVMTQSRFKIKVRNAAASGVSGLSGVTARRAGFKVGILDDVESKSLRLGGADIQQEKCF